MASMHGQILPLGWVARQKSHADLKRAVPGIGVCRAVCCTLQLHLGCVARQLAQGLRQKQLDSLLADTGKGV